MADIAERSGVHVTSLYRRWGTPAAVLLDAALVRLAEEVPLPDTGSLRGDLVAYAEQAARGLAEPGGLRMLQTVLAAAASPGDDGRDRRRLYLDRRAEAIQRMLDRAAARGEVRLHWSDVVDGVLAPVYLRRLFDVEFEDGFAELLADRVLAGPRRRGGLPARSPLGESSSASQP